eukprot:2172889-Prorocentrum_lima.AAC.1
MCSLCCFAARLGSAQTERPTRPRTPVQLRTSPAGSAVPSQGSLPHRSGPASPWRRIRAGA